MNEIFKMTLVLSLICGLSGVSLASLKDATALSIENQILINVQAPALAQVLPEHDNDPIADRKTFTAADGSAIMVFPAIKDGALMGVAFETASKGYGGTLGVMTGFSLTDDTLAGIAHTTMKETPGIGSRVTDDSFLSQFRGHSMDNVALKKEGGDVSAVAGATISSTGTVAALQQAIEIFAALKSDITAQWTL